MRKGVSLVSEILPLDGLQTLFQYEVPLQTGTWVWERSRALAQVSQGVGTCRHSIPSPEWVPSPMASCTSLTLRGTKGDNPSLQGSGNGLSVGSQGHWVL